MFFFDPEELSFVEWFAFCFVSILIIFTISQCIAMFYQCDIGY